VLDYSRLYDLAVDPRGGLVWTLLTVPAPEMPEEPPPSIRSPEEGLTVADRYRDHLIEVVALDGRLIPSRWYRDRGSVAPPVPYRPPDLGTTATRPSRTMSTSSPREPMSSLR